MKKIQTSSDFTWVCQRFGKKFVRQYKRDKWKTHAYPRTLDLGVSMKMVNATQIKCPKLLKNRLKYIDEEFIDGTIIDDKFDRKVIIDTIVNYITIMTNINCNEISNNVKWKNNSEFLNFMVENLKKTKTTFLVTVEKIISEFGLEETIFNNYKLDDKRLLSFIHGDINKDNMLATNGGIYLLDWELATYGDLAYEIAMHFILMKYSSEERTYFLDKLCTSILVDRKTLTNDINLYYLYELLRRIYIRSNKVYNLLLKNKDITASFDELYECYFEYTNMLRIKVLNKNELKIIFIKYDSV